MDGAKQILGCSKTCNEAVRGDMGLDTLHSHRDRAKLKWSITLVSSPVEKNSKFSQNGKLIWNGKFSHNGKMDQNGKFDKNGKFG